MFEGGRTWLDPVLRPIETVFYRASGIDAAKGQSWIGYTGALIAFNAAGFFFLYAILRLQGVLPLNPLNFAGMSPHLRSTPPSARHQHQLQSYSGESTLSNLSQMSGLTVQNFASAATGVAVVGRWRGPSRPIGARASATSGATSCA